MSRSNNLRRLLSLWRGVHRPMAMAMVVATTIHVALAALATWSDVNVFAEETWYAVFGGTAIVGLFFLGVELRIARQRRQRGRDDLRARIRSEIEGLDEPPTLHPVIDLDRCIGSAACVAACPEGDILGLVDGAGRLITGANCIGHGRCAAECPTQAITLVFGTARRGVDIPVVSGDFESDVPGLFLSGEIGGMGLIRNAVTQSIQAIGAIAKRPRGRGEELDLVIVGGGPAGMTAALAAKRAGLRFELLEQEQRGGAILHYPRRKVVTTHPFTLPGCKTCYQRTIPKEDLLELFEIALGDAGIRVHEGEHVQAVRSAGEGEAQGFVIETARRSLRARTVLLSIGRRGTPRHLDVPGEDLPKVIYALIDPEQHRARHALVVGGGDSAVEAALALADAGAASVTLSYRQATLSRPKTVNRERFAEAVAAGRVTFAAETQVTRIEQEFIWLKGTGGEEKSLPNDVLVVLAGGVLPTAFLKAAGVIVERCFGEA